MPALQGTQQGNSSAIPMTHFNAHRTCCHRHGQAVGTAHCMGDDRKQVASIPRNHCSHACDNHDCKKKSKKSEKASPQAGACVCGGGKYQKSAGRGKPKKKEATRSKKTARRWELRQSPENKRDAQKYEKQTATLFCLGLSFGLPLLCFVSDFEGTARHAFSHVAGPVPRCCSDFFTKQIG